MKKTTKQPPLAGGPGRGAQILATVSQESPTASVEAAFGKVVNLIRAARQRADQMVNTGMIGLYWRIGQYLHHKIEADGRAKGTVVQLAAYIALLEPSKCCFSSQNLWRMRQFFKAYPAAAKLSQLVRVLPWTHTRYLLRLKDIEQRMPAHLKGVLTVCCGRP